MYLLKQNTTEVGSNLIFVLFLSFKYHQTFKSFGFCGKRCQGQLNSTNFTQSLIKLKRNLIQNWEIHIILFSESPMVIVLKILTYLHKRPFQSSSPNLNLESYIILFINEWIYVDFFTTYYIIRSQSYFWNNLI